MTVHVNADRIIFFYSLLLASVQRVKPGLGCVTSRNNSHARKWFMFSHGLLQLLFHIKCHAQLRGYLVPGTKHLHHAWMWGCTNVSPLPWQNNIALFPGSLEMWGGLALSSPSFLVAVCTWKAGKGSGNEAREGLYPVGVCWVMYSLPHVTSTVDFFYG